MVFLGIGMEPNRDVEMACGLAVDNGIVVDMHGRTSDPFIYAVGDVANQPCSWIGAPATERVRLESWANAQNQSIAVGERLAGRDPAPQDLPWFWSDQFDVNLQEIGRASCRERVCQYV